MYLPPYPSTAQKAAIAAMRESFVSRLWGAAVRHARAGRQRHASQETVHLPCAQTVPSAGLAVTLDWL